MAPGWFQALITRGGKEEGSGWGVHGKTHTGGAHRCGAVAGNSNGCANGNSNSAGGGNGCGNGCGDCCAAGRGAAARGLQRGGTLALPSRGRGAAKQSALVRTKFK